MHLNEYEQNFWSSIVFHFPCLIQFRSGWVFFNCAINTSGRRRWIVTGTTFYRTRMFPLSLSISCYLATILVSHYLDSRIGTLAPDCDIRVGLTVSLTYPNAFCYLIFLLRSFSLAIVVIYIRRFVWQRLVYYDFVFFKSFYLSYFSLLRSRFSYV